MAGANYLGNLLRISGLALTNQYSGTKLNCGVHDCPYKCHQLSDHSKMQCYKITEWRCPRNHRIKMPCSQIQGVCQLCIDEDQVKDRQRKRDMELEAERARRQKEYMLQLTELQDEITHIRRLQKDIKDEDERRKVLQRHQQNLERLRAVPRTLPPTGEENSQPSQERSYQDTRPTEHSTNASPLNGRADKPAMAATEPWSSAAADWEYQKKFEGARSDEIDSLMSMIGLEEVKQKFLAIKGKVDTATRQNIDLKNERFGTVLIGNPGTGKSAFSLQRALAEIYGR